MGGRVRVKGDGFATEKSAVSEQDKSHSVTPAGTISHDSTRTQRKSSNVTVGPKGVTTLQSTSMSSSEVSFSQRIHGIVGCHATTINCIPAEENIFFIGNSKGQISKISNA